MPLVHKNAPARSSRSLDRMWTATSRLIGKLTWMSPYFPWLDWSFCSIIRQWSWLGNAELETSFCRILRGSRLIEIRKSGLKAGSDARNEIMPWSSECKKVCNFKVTQSKSILETLLEHFIRPWQVRCRASTVDTAVGVIVFYVSTRHYFVYH